ncbi:Serine-threonine protein kinase 19 [Gracilaria domingensis]|nr:Serine-threonine protein kinase 19 [Gracilaria domingensis]
MNPSNTLNPQPVKLKPRRTTRRRPPSQRRPRKERPNPSQNEEDLLLTTISSIPDTHVALRVLREDWSEAANQDLPNTPPLVLKTQLNALVANKTEMHRELDEICLHGLRRIVLPGGGDCFILPKDFRARATDSSLPFMQKFFNDVFEQNHQPWLTLSSLRTVYGEETDDAVNQLVRAGYLTSQDEQSFNFAFPGMGAFMRNRRSGENEITAILRKAPYKEMGLTKLEMRSLKNTCFTARWHVRDVVGSGKAECVDTPVGVLVRLRVF